jgi:hypothetical protein
MLNYLDLQVEQLIAITKSGSNDFEGSTYFFYRDQSLAGKTPRKEEVLLVKKLAGYCSNLWVGRWSNSRKYLFYFINYEGTGQETQGPFDINDYLEEQSGPEFQSLYNIWRYL